MSKEADKINQISKKISALITVKNHQKEELDRLLEENGILKEERFTLANQNSMFQKEIEKLKTIDRSSSDKKLNLEEDKINGMIREIEDCLALLKK